MAKTDEEEHKPSPAKRARVNGTKSGPNGAPNHDCKQFPDPPLAAATDEDKRRWTGFCEIESEPAFFNYILKKWGVKGVKVQEVIGLDEELLAWLPKPVYGLLLCFRYSPDDVTTQVSSCPENVWFANQTHNNICATVSLLNVINNISELDLGPNLGSFKDFTSSFTPASRGDAIGNFDFLRQIHNSFARKMEMLNVDLSLKNEFDDRNKPKKKIQQPKPKAKKGRKRKGVVTEDDYEEEENPSAFHYIAYVPIDGEVWKLDGLDRQPAKLGSTSYEEWLSHVSVILQDRMANAEGEAFSLLGIVRDPLYEHQQSLAENIKTLNFLESQLDLAGEDWKTLDPIPLTAGPNTEQVYIWGPDDGLGVTRDMIDEAKVLDKVVQFATERPENLMTSRINVLSAQAGLMGQIRDEKNACAAEERKAEQRRHDYGPLLHAWVKMLAENEGLLKDLIEETR